jgi:hypothetical protein
MLGKALGQALASDGVILEDEPGHRAK